MSENVTLGAFEADVAVQGSDVPAWSHRRVDRSLREEDRRPELGLDRLYGLEDDNENHCECCYR